MTRLDSRRDPDRPDYSESMLAAMLGQYAVMQVVVAATGMIRNKVIALRLGPSAFGELAQLGAVVGAVTAVTTFGMQVSLSRTPARATTFAERQAFLASANGLVLTLSFLAMSATFVLLLAGDLLTLVGLPVTPDVVVAAACPWPRSRFSACRRTSWHCSRACWMSRGWQRSAPSPSWSPRRSASR